MVKIARFLSLKQSCSFRISTAQPILPSKDNLLGLSLLETNNMLSNPFQNSYPD
jgi:hypothetical protein